MTQLWKFEYWLDIWYSRIILSSKYDNIVPLCFQSPDIWGTHCNIHEYKVCLESDSLFPRVQGSLSWREMKFAVRRFKLGAGDWDSVLMEGREGMRKRSKHCSLFSSVHLAIRWILNSNNFLSIQQKRYFSQRTDWLCSIYYLRLYSKHFMQINSLDSHENSDEEMLTAKS